MSISKEQVIADMRRVSRKLKRTPSRSQYRKNGHYSSDTVERVMGSYSAAKRKV